VEVEGFMITRNQQEHERPDGKGCFPVKTYTFTRVLPAPQSSQSSQ
jgi:hypothetical protein